MIRKEIKLKATAAKVAKELVNDLTQELDCFGTYEVKLENLGMYYDVVVTSPKCLSNILTSPCIDRIITVVKMYELQYINVSYHIDVVEAEEKYLPAIIIQVTYSK
jgi:hypothetical protein